MTSLLNIAGNIPVVAEAGGQSLRFEDGDSAYLSWTPASAGNRKTWTYSTWIKRANLGGTQLFGINSGDSWMIRFSTSNKIACNFANDTATNYFADSTRVFRDVSAWYHIVVSCDTTQSTASDRVKIYVNGELETITGGATTIPQNRDTDINVAAQHRIGAEIGNRYYSDGYIANACFIDGQQLDPTSFGEYQDTLWKPKSDTDIQSLTFGTNGFYLPFKQTTEAEGFSTVTYTGNGSDQSVKGVGFEADLVWIKRRDGAVYHNVFDSLRTDVNGMPARIYTNATTAEQPSIYSTETGNVQSFTSTGFELGNGGNTNTSGGNYVAWCWDAGTGSAASNTDGSITSTVKANTAKGFSIVSYTGTGANATVGHGLSSAPEMIILKNRTSALGWPVYHSANGATKFMQLEITNAVQTASTVWQDTAPTSSVFSIGTSTYVNQSSSNFIAYCFHSVSGYSSFGSYTGTGGASPAVTVTTGFKPAFVMIKRTDSTGSWYMLDNTRFVTDENNNVYLEADTSDAEATASTNNIDFTSTGFVINSTGSAFNASGGSYIYLAFADTRDATFFGDTSGNGNNWTPNALNNTDVVPDSPVTGGNFSVMNPLSWNVMTFAEGNLKITTTTNYRSVHSTFAIPSTGKWIYEFVATDYTSGGGAYIGFSNNINEGDNEFTGDHGVYYQTYNGGFNVEGTVSTATGYSVGSVNFTSDGDIHTIAIDMDNQKLYFAKNGAWRNSADPAAGTGGLDISSCFTSPETDFHACITRGGSYNETYTFNFGQDSSFAGTKTPQGNTDDNGVGDFYYAPPSGGFLALTTGNLPAATITAPDEYHGTLLFTGNGSTQSITGLGWQPDFTWIKMRSDGTRGHALFDAVRGGTERLDSSSTQEGRTNEGNISFDVDGFSVTSSHPTVNDSGDSAVAWNWLAGGTAVSNTDGTATSQVSANTDAGFSIVSWTQSSGATFGHGLSQIPELFIHKRRTATGQWPVYTTATGSKRGLELNSTGASFDASAVVWDATTFTNFTGDSGDWISYCFHSVEGYSKIGSYTGNGSADGVYVHCGFRPSWIMIKCTSGTSNWLIRDVKRDTYNQSVTPLAPNLSAAESSFSTTLNETDILSNGFKLRDNYGDQNGSGQTYIFIAFASAPFKSANAR